MKEEWGKVIKLGKEEPAIAEPILIGITRAALADSIISLLPFKIHQKFKQSCFQIAWDQVDNLEEFKRRNGGNWTGLNPLLEQVMLNLENPKTLKKPYRIERMSIPLLQST